MHVSFLGSAVMTRGCRLKGDTIQFTLEDVTREEYAHIGTLLDIAQPGPVLPGTNVVVCIYHQTARGS